MVSNASPGTTAPKMNESFIHMVHVSSDCACTQDGYLKHPHLTIIDGDVGQWLIFGWFWGWGTSDTQLTRRKLGKKTHPNHGSRHCPMAAMVPSPQHHQIQQLANMLRNKSVLFKLEKIILCTMY
jgi:hypothetical protein